MPKVIAVMPVKGRMLLVPYTIRRLKKIGIDVICVTEMAHERKICQDAGAYVSTLGRVPLGRKWNGAFLFGKSFNPDYVLYVGSSDWVSDNWLDVMMPIAQDYELVGTTDFYELHLEYDIKHNHAEDYQRDEVNSKLLKMTLGYWPGYRGEREGEPIGIGRIISRDYLQRVNWMPFEDSLHKNLDKSMFDKAKSFKSIKCDEIKSLAISTTLWSNRHKFYLDIEKENIIKQKKRFLNKWFPESYKLF